MIWRVSTMVLAGGVAAMLGVWVSEREPPVYVYGYAMETTEVPAGEQLRINIRVSRKKACETIVERWLYDGKGGRWSLDRHHWLTPPGKLGDDSYTSIIPIPQAAAPGIGLYRSITTYKCNPMHNFWPIVGQPVEASFTILPALRGN